jgi:hypothetical protein
MRIKSVSAECVPRLSVDIDLTYLPVDEARDVVPVRLMKIAQKNPPP